jgi:C-terminal processing protease CtpA/Prc
VIDTALCPIDYVSMGRFNADKGCQVMRAATESKSGQTAGIMLDFSKAGGGLIPQIRGCTNLYPSQPIPRSSNSKFTKH